jgi:hypothetical protein
MTYSSTTKLTIVTPPTIHAGRFFGYDCEIDGYPGPVMRDPLSLLAVSRP